jgi:hypothetical protein
MEFRVHLNITLYVELHSWGLRNMQPGNRSDEDYRDLSSCMLMKILHGTLIRLYTVLLQLIQALHSEEVMYGFVII